MGFSPHDLLASALATCTSITLRMYADRKQWELSAVEVYIEIGHDAEEMNTIFDREIILHGNLSAEEKQRLLQIANKCPVHKILEKPSIIRTTLHELKR